MNPPLPLAEAQRRLLAEIEPLPVEQVPVLAARGRYLAETLVAWRTQPAADLSAMDGYAMRAGESGQWRMVGESAAGHPFTGSLRPGEAVRISTGALMPAEAEVVLLQENAIREGDLLSLNGEGPPSARHVRRAGFDFASGEALLGAGTSVGAPQIALALAAGHAEVCVRRRPRLAVLDTGDELALDPAECALHQIPRSNGAMIAALASPLADQTELVGPVPDDAAILAQALASLEHCDVIVTTGGASVGDHDVLRPALEAWGATLDFWRVAMKPGKPVLVARKGGTVLLGLPGNPVSSYVTAQMFLLPLLRKLAGAAEPVTRPGSAQLTRALATGGSRLEFIRGRVEGDQVTPLDQQDSSALRSLAKANVLIEVAIGAPAAEVGTRVPIYYLGNGGIA